MIFYVSICILAAFWMLLIVLRRDTLERGKKEEKLKNAEDTLDDIYLVKKARAAYDANHAVRDKLRKKYERKP